jgi:hypothetical protein
MDIGFILHLGHGGHPCPANTHIDGPDITMCVVDTLGITHHRVHTCHCQDARPVHIQLLQMKLFPSTMERPQTVFTFSVLDRYQIISLEGKTSASNFYSQLRRLTDSCFPHLLPVCISANSLFGHGHSHLDRIDIGSSSVSHANGETWCLENALAKDMICILPPQKQALRYSVLHVHNQVSTPLKTGKTIPSMDSYICHSVN